MESEGVLLMYQDMYERWLAAELDDADLKPELESVKGDDAAIQDRFAVALKFGTAGLRGVGLFRKLSTDCMTKVKFMP